MLSGQLRFETIMLSCPVATCACPFSRCRFASEFCSRQQKPRQSKLRKATESSSLERREAERRQAHQTGAASKSDAARVLISVPQIREDLRPQGFHKALGLMERARSPFGAPPRHFAGFHPGSASGPRFLEPPDASGRTLSGTSAASTLQSGTRRTGRCPSRPCAQCMAAPARTAPAPPQGVPSR